MPQQRPPSKMTATQTKVDINTWKSPPEFWDRLSKIELTRSALREHDRRTKLSRTKIPQPYHSIPHITNTPRITRAVTKAVARFAKGGGPDISDLRGYPYPQKADPAVAMVGPRQISHGGDSRSVDPASTQQTSTTSKSNRSTTVYSRNFEQHLTDHDVRATYASDEPGLQEVIEALAVPRPSLTPSHFSDGAFKSFREANARAKDEADVVANVLPTILGPYQASNPCARNTLFDNLEPLTDGTIAPTKPDIYFGSPPEELFSHVRDELEHHIVPSSMQDKPVAPNFFFEVKGRDGSVGVLIRQACYDGAVGSRAMHSLQNYGQQPQYDGRAYTFSMTYHNGHLQMYAHHPSSPRTDGGPPSYHMTEVEAWALTGSRDGFTRGIIAFRNARDLAKDYQDRFIQAANSRALPKAHAAPRIADFDNDNKTSVRLLVDGEKPDFAFDSFAPDSTDPRPKRKRQPASSGLSLDSDIKTKSSPCKKRRPRSRLDKR